MEISEQDILLFDVKRGSTMLESGLEVFHDEIRQVSTVSGIDDI
jgi:hypothetical protein